ncbi:MAG: prepilin-type N-terminal cleavage/methylation domain-containing protein [bacterium]|nr:prepilin-type N-terminal cleavage/methylation domain-containing protein [bacterium]
MNKRNSGFTAIELLIVAFLIAIAAAFAFFGYGKVNRGKESSVSGGLKTVSSSQSEVPPTNGPKIAENRSERSQDRFFYNFQYYRVPEGFKVDLKIKVNDANKKITGFQFDFKDQNPGLLAPAGSTLTINGSTFSGNGGGDWKCQVSGTIYKCQGTQALIVDEEHSFQFSYPTPPKLPQSLKANLITGDDQSLVPVTPLLQNK